MLKISGIWPPRGPRKSTLAAVRLLLCFCIQTSTQKNRIFWQNPQDIVLAAKGLAPDVVFDKKQ